MNQIAARWKTTNASMPETVKNSNDGKISSCVGPTRWRFGRSIIRKRRRAGSAMPIITVPLKAAVTGNT